MEILKLLIIFLLFFTGATRVDCECRQLDDIYFHGIYGGLFLDHHMCTNETGNFIQYYVNNKIRSDTKLTIQDSNLHTLEKSLFSQKKTVIIVLELINCNINQFERDSLKQIQKLYNLTLIGNDMKTIEVDSSLVVNNNKRFRNFNLTNNNIGKIGDLCYLVDTIRSISLSDNPIERIDDRNFKSCVNLQFLDISNISLLEINGDAFGNNKMLNDLIIKDNRLTTLNYIYRTQLNNLIYLDASKNNLSEFDVELFYYVPSVRILDLGHNAIATFNCVSNRTIAIPLRKLLLNNNDITYINISRFAELHSIDLSYNSIDTLPYNYFENNQQLLHLHLSNNLLRDVPTVFSPLVDLIDLDLSSNNIAHVDSYVFAPLRSLRKLNIDDNLLLASDYQSILKALPSLQTFTLNARFPCRDLHDILTHCALNNVSCSSANVNYETPNIYGIPCRKQQITTAATTTTAAATTTATSAATATKSNEIVREKLVREQDRFDNWMNLTINYFAKGADLSDRQISEWNKFNAIFIVFVLIFFAYLVYNAVGATCKRNPLKKSDIGRLELLPTHDRDNDMI